MHLSDISFLHIVSGNGFEFSVSYMNSFNQTESTVFQGSLYFQGIPFHVYLEISEAVTVPCGGRKISPRTSI